MGMAIEEKFKWPLCVKRRTAYICFWWTPCEPPPRMIELKNGLKLTWRKKGNGADLVSWKKTCAKKANRFGARERAAGGSWQLKGGAQEKHGHIFLKKGEDQRAHMI